MTLICQAMNVMGRWDADERENDINSDNYNYTV